MKTSLFPYQTVLAAQVSEEFNAGRSDVVLAAACGAGKTITSIAICEELLKKDPTLRILVLTHGQVLLRTQFISDIIEQQPEFTYTVVKSCRDLDVTAQVYVGLPHTIHNCKQHKFDVVIIDEAHHFYFRPEGMVQSIIKNSKPRFTLFLTGSPSKFIKQQYTLYSISLLELYELGRVCSPVVELAQSTYDYTFADYNNHQELKSSVQFTSTQTNATLDNLLTQVLRVLKSADRATPEVRKANVSIQWKDALRLLDKTMFVCRSQQQAKLVREYLEAAGVDVALSTSEFDGNSEEFERFKQDGKCIALVVVNRGTLGFNMPELVNIVDMSGSLNIDVLFQIFARLVRRHPTAKGKLFLKVVPETMAEYVYVLMSFVIALSHKPIYETYAGVVKKTRIPVPGDYAKSVQAISVQEGTRRPRHLKFAELPSLLSMEIMKSLSHKNGELFSSYAYTTLEEVGNRLKTPFLPFEEAHAFAKSLGLKSHTEWPRVCPANIPCHPNTVYKLQWKGWGDWLGTGNVRRKSLLSFEDARAFARTSGLKSRKEWFEWAKATRPKDVPHKPHEYYKDLWKGWNDWLGTTTNRICRAKLLPFKKVRAHARSLRVNGRKQWDEWRISNRPSGIPSNPQLAYKDEWIGWGDFLGTGNVHRKDFLSYEKACAYVRSSGVRGRTGWLKLKRPSTLPSNPDKYYKEEWIGWREFFGTAERSAVKARRKQHSGRSGRAR